MMTRNVLDAMIRTKTDEQTFFRKAHVFSYGADADVSNDVAQFKMHAIVPFYVRKYVSVILLEGLS